MNIAALVDEGLAGLEEPGTLVYVSGAGPDTEHSGTDIHSQGVRFAAALTGLGLRPGDRVGVVLPNSPEVGAVYHGIQRMGGVVLPMLFLLAPPEIRHILADSGASAVVTSPEFLGNVREAADGVEAVRHIVSVGGGEHALPFADLVETAPADFPVADRSDDDLAILIYTGGTTGRPKGVMLSHGNLAFAADAAARVTVENMRGFGLEPGRAPAISALPLAHSFGVIVSLIGPKVQKLAGVKRGGRSVLMRWFDPEQWFRCVEEYGCMVSPLVPTMLAYLMDHPAGDRYDTSTLTTVACAAAPLPVELLHRFEEKFDCAVLESYGLTESAPVATSNRAGARKVGTVGIPYPGIDLEIRDPVSGERLPPESAGEVCLRGPNIMQGYWNNPEATAQAVRDGWLHTGDIGALDSDGFLTIVDRVKNLIIRGGLNIYPRDVEETLHRHPSVLEAAVVGVPDARYGEEVEAFVVLRPGAEATPEEILGHCRSELAKYKTPKTVHFVATLPKSGVGKVLHRELRDEAVRRREAVAP